MFIGVIERSAVFATRRAALGYAVMFVVIVIACSAAGKLSRAMGERLDVATVKEYRPIPAELRRLPEVIWGRIGLMSIVGALVLAAPWLLGEFETPKATVMVLYAIIGVSLVILTGWAGQISLGQYAIAGIGSAWPAGWPPTTTGTSLPADSAARWRGRSWQSSSGCRRCGSRGCSWP